jgi:hypothetical protein
LYYCKGWGLAGFANRPTYNNTHFEWKDVNGYGFEWKYPTQYLAFKFRGKDGDNHSIDGLRETHESGKPVLLMQRLTK